MPQHDFTKLQEKYPQVIGQMADTFSSHEFILKLAQEYQWLYVEALNSYRYELIRGAPAPFMKVHVVLAKHLKKYPELLEQTHKAVKSKNIFGQRSTCARWKKVEGRGKDAG